MKTNVQMADQSFSRHPGEELNMHNNQLVREFYVNCLKIHHGVINQSSRDCVSQERCQSLMLQKERIKGGVL